MTYSWSKADTSLDRVYSLAISYCDGWNAPPKLIADQIDGEQHTSTFKCVPRPTLPFGQHGPGPATEQDLAMADPTELSAREAVRELRRRRFRRSS